MSANKAKGTRAESAIVTFLRPFFPWADRVPLSGKADRGDITIGPGGPTIEAKNQSRHSIAEWLDEAEAESRNAGTPFGLAWFKRRGKSNPGDWYVLMSGHSLVRLLVEAGYGPTPAPTADPIPGQLAVDEGGAA